MEYREVLAVRPFRLLFIGQAISQFGDSFYYVVFMFMVSKVTGSSAAVGYIGATETIPFLLLSPLAGVLADRIDRRRIMLFTVWASAAILFAFAAIVATQPRPPVWSFFVTVLLLSIVTTFFMPAKNAAVPALVPTDKILQATSLNAMTQGVMPMLALALSATVLGILYKISPTGFFLTAILVNALSFVGAALYLHRLPPIVPDRDHEPPHPWTDMKDGARYVAGRLDLKVLLFLGALMNLTVSPFFVAYIAANKAWLGDRPDTLAWIEASFFAGILISSFFVGKWNIRRVGLAFIGGVAMVGIPVVFMGYSVTVWQFVLWNFVAGLSLPFAQIPLAAYLQASVPDAFRGRVNSLLGMVNMGVMPVGMAFGGVLIDRIGLTNAFVAMGVGMFCASVLGLAFPSFRDALLPESEQAADQPQ